MLKIWLNGETAELKEGLELILPQLNVKIEKDGIPVSVKQGDKLSVKLNDKEGSIVYSKKVEFFRALSYIEQYGTSCDVEESAKLQNVGVMLDLTLNGVMTPEALARYFSKMALMGLNTAVIKQLMEVESYPLYGYLRGRYTPEEMKQIDDYAYALGIEVIPGIDTLAHLECEISWPAMGGLADSKGVLCVGEENTYKFIEDCLKALTAPYRSNRVFIGLDETLRIGRGKYLRKHGFKETADIISEHVENMRPIFDRLGIKPMMWSDIYLDKPDSQAVIASAKSMDIMYKADNSADTKVELDVLKKFSSNVMYVGESCFKYSVVPRYDITVNSAASDLAECINSGVKEAVALMSCEDGAEAEYFAGLYLLQVYAETAYTGEYNEEKAKARFAACAGADADAFLGLNEFDTLGGVSGNPCKFLLYQDPIIPMFEKDCEGYKFSELYSELQTKCAAWREENPAFAVMFDFYEKLAAMLSAKCKWHEAAGNVVRSKDRAAAKELAMTAPAIITSMNELRQSWRNMWYETRKIAGFEVVDVRLGGVTQRMSSAGRRMKMFADGAVDDIEELSAAKLPYATFKDGTIGRVDIWKDISTSANLII